jgi:hypothetical protein
MKEPVADRRIEGERRGKTRGRVRGRENPGRRGMTLAEKTT